MNLKAPSVRWLAPALAVVERSLAVQLRSKLAGVPGPQVVTGVEPEIFLQQK